MDLASSLGVVAASSPVDQPARSSASTPRSVPAKKPSRPAPKREAQASDSDFGRGLLEDIPVSEEEHRQEQLLSEMFVPSDEPFVEPTGGVRQVDDVNVDDEEELIDDEELAERIHPTELLDEDMVEFEVEELSSEEENRRSEFARRSPPPRGTPARRRERDDEQEFEEAQSERPPKRDRDDGRRRRSRRGERDRDRGPAQRRPTPSERPRSEVLPADEDFIVDPLDEESAEQAQAAPAESGDTKSIKFPTWFETVSPIIEANIARRGKPRSRPRRPPRDRGGGD
jgi:hypothetical protein